MRTTTATNGTTINYPDEFGFVYLPTIISVAKNDLVKLEVTLTDEDNNVIDSITASSYHGRAHIDISAYVQTLFDAKSVRIPQTYSNTIADTFIVRDVTAQVKATLANAVDTFNFYTTFIWGAPKSLEVFNKPRKVRYFTNYPFRLSLFSLTGTTHRILKDGQLTTIEPISTGMWLINMNPYKNANKVVVKDNVGTLTPKITAQGATVTQATDASDVERFDVVLDKVTDTGIYLRWIDRCGFLCHFLFKCKDEIINAAEESNYLRNAIGSDSDYGFGGSYGTLANKTRSESKTIAAPQLDKDEWWWIADVLTSPIVQMYLGDNSWQNVRVNGGSFKHDAETDLQDFACTLIIDDVNTQRL